MIKNSNYVTGFLEIIKHINKPKTWLLPLLSIFWEAGSAVVCVKIETAPKRGGCIQLSNAIVSLPFIGLTLLIFLIVIIILVKLFEEDIALSVFNAAMLSFIINLTIIFNIEGVFNNAALVAIYVCLIILFLSLQFFIPINRMNYFGDELISTTTLMVLAAGSAVVDTSPPGVCIFYIAAVISLIYYKFIKKELYYFLLLINLSLIFTFVFAL